MISFHGKKEYWANLLNGIERKPGYADRLSLDLYRLKLVVGQVSKTNDYMEMSKLSVLEGYPSEALKVIDAGYKAGALGTGAEAERHNRLREMAKKRLVDNGKAQVANEAEATKNQDGSDLSNLGYAYVTAGQFDKGIAMIEKGISKGGMKYDESAKLHLGMAYLQAGKKTNALKIFKTVQGKDGTADLARYWTLYANQSVK
jgi:tetratricopeptide (TPR) repeat protein